MAEPCICTEPPSDAARIAGMSWGGVSATISGACPLCQGDAGCPPQCRSLKPFPAPPPGGGWCAPSYEEVFGYPDPHALDLPSLSVKRGGIRYPRFSVITHVRSHKAHWWSRKTWTVYVQAWDGTKHDKHEIRGFHTEHDANNAEAIVQFTVKAINNNYEKFEERESAR